MGSVIIGATTLDQLKVWTHGMVWGVVGEGEGTLLPLGKGAKGAFLFQQAELSCLDLKFAHWWRCSVLRPASHSCFRVNSWSILQSRGRQTMHLSPAPRCAPASGVPRTAHKTIASTLG